MKRMRFLIFTFLTVLLLSCTNNKPALHFEFGNSTETTNEFTLYKHGDDFYVLPEDSFKKKIDAKKVKKIYFTNQDDTIEVVTHNIFYSPDEYADYTSPLSRSGSIVWWKYCSTAMFLIASKNNKKILEIAGSKMKVCPE